MSTLFLLFSTAFSQENKKFLDSLFVSAREQLSDSLYDEALKCYQTIIHNSAPNSTLYAKAVFNTGWTYILQNKTDSAKEIFLAILKSRFNEMDKGGRGGGLMGEPYALYKHNACENLVRIEMSQQNFKEALKYIRLFDKKYPYKHFCGNEMKGYAIFKARIYAEAYVGLQDTTKALDYLLPEVFESGLASNTQLVETTVSLLKKLYTPEEIATGIQKAMTSISIRTYWKRKYRYDIVKIIFMNRSIVVPDYDPDYLHPKDDYKKLTELEKVQLIIKNSEFYKQLSN